MRGIAIILAATLASASASAQLRSSSTTPPPMRSCRRSVPAFHRPSGRVSYQTTLKPEPTTTALTSRLRKGHLCGLWHRASCSALSMVVLADWRC